MGLKGIIYKGAACAAIITSGAAGYYLGQDREYRVQRQGDCVSLYSMALDKAHPITQANKDFYLGDSDHNLQGVKDVAKAEGQQSMKPEIEAVTEQRDNVQSELTKREIKDGLVGIVEGAKLGAGNLMQGVKNVWYDIKYGN